LNKIGLDLGQAGSPEKLNTQDIVFSDGSRREKFKGKVRELAKKAFRSTVENVPEEEEPTVEATNKNEGNEKRTRVSIGNEVEGGLEDEKKKKKKEKKEKEEKEDYAPRRRARGISAASAKEIANFCGEM